MPHSIYLPYYSVCTLSKLFCNRISFVHDEVLVKHLEDFTASKITHVERVYVFEVLLGE